MIDLCKFVITAVSQCLAVGYYRENSVASLEINVTEQRCEFTNSIYTLTSQSVDIHFSISCRINLALDCVKTNHFTGYCSRRFTKLPAIIISVYLP